MNKIDPNGSTDAVGEQPNFGKWTNEQWGTFLGKLQKENASLHKQLAEAQEFGEVTERGALKLIGG